MQGLLSFRWKLVIGCGAAAVASGILLASHGFDGRRSRLAERIASVPLQFWSVAALDAEGAVRGTEAKVCADPMVRQGFELALPNINGEPCLVTRTPVIHQARYDARCFAGGQEYAVNLSRTGDLDSDFTVRMRVQPLGNAHPGVLQTLRYRKLGPCPTGWKAGQTMGGDGESYDALDTRH